MNKLTLITAAAASTLALAACGDNTADETTDLDTDTDTMATDTAMVDDGMPAGGELSEAQQANYDAIDRQAISDEYDANRDAMNQEMTGDAGAMNAGGDMASENDMSSSGAMAGSMPARGEMDFMWLDRNSDGQLSVAEYALWALPASPNTAAPNDQTKPYLTDNQINQAAQTFFYFDNDGNSYLSEGEFQAARDSSRTV